MADISNKEQKVRVSIFGEEYSVIGHADREYILRVADLVDRKMREIAMASKNKSPNRIAVLTALNLAGELLEIKEKTESDLSKVENRAKNILELLDSKLSEPE
jgi:cell division protein ZapA